MTTHPTRADWWREVTDPNEIIPMGCWVRIERGPVWVEERCFAVDTRREGWASDRSVFIDSRWQPPKPTYRAGDVITECTDATLPADGVGIVDAFGFVGQMDDDEVCWALGGGTKWASGICERELPLTVIYVPKAGDSDD